MQRGRPAKSERERACRVDTELSVDGGQSNSTAVFLLPVWPASIVTNDGRSLQFAQYNTERLKARWVAVNCNRDVSFRILEIADTAGTK
jgi:hypothetical protein